MTGIDYSILPVMMGGLVSEIRDDGSVKINLHGRLGVITVPRRLILDQVELELGHEVKFYFSYFQVNETPYDYDASAVDPSLDPEPCLIGARICEVNDTAIKAEMMDGLGTVAVPRRWVFTDVTLAEGQNVEFYFSCMKITGKRTLPKA